MKDLYIKGLAIHDDSESCLGGRKADGEAFTGERVGWVLSCEINALPQGGLLRGADVLESRLAAATRSISGAEGVIVRKPSAAHAWRSSVNAPVGIGAGL